MEPAPPILPYEDSLEVDGLAVTRGDGFFRVVTPRLRGTKAIGKGWLAGSTYFLLITVLALVMAMRAGPGRSADLLQATINGTLAGLFIALSVRRLRQQYVFQMTNTEFLIHRRPRSVLNRSWLIRRSAVREIKPSIVDNRVLAVRIEGRDIQELFINHDPAIVRRLSELLNEALRAPTHPTRASTNVLPATAATHVVSGRLLAPTILAIAVAAGLYVTWLGSMAGGIWTMFLLASLVGIVYGTQKKDFWL